MKQAGRRFVFGRNAILEVAYFPLPRAGNAIQSPDEGFAAINKDPAACCPVPSPAFPLPSVDKLWQGIATELDVTSPAPVCDSSTLAHDNAPTQPGYSQA